MKIHWQPATHNQLLAKEKNGIGFFLCTFLSDVKTSNFTPVKIRISQGNRKILSSPFLVTIQQDIPVLFPFCGRFTKTYIETGFIFDEVFF